MRKASPTLNVFKDGAALSWWWIVLSSTESHARWKQCPLFDMGSTPVTWESLIRCWPVLNASLRVVYQNEHTSSSETLASTSIQWKIITLGFPLSDYHHLWQLYWFSTDCSDINFHCKMKSCNKRGSHSKGLYKESDNSWEEDLAQTTKTGGTTKGEDTVDAEAWAGHRIGEPDVSEGCRATLGSKKCPENRGLC